MYVTIDDAERAAGKMTADKARRAADAVRTDGYVVLENVLPHEPLDILHEKMDEDAALLIRMKKWGGAGHLQGHLQQGPPPFAPYVFPEIVSNPLIVQVTKELLGAGLYNCFYNGNTNCPGSVTQPLHRDGRHLWEDMSVGHPPASVVVNIALEDVDEENGSIELWRGTHLDTTVDRRIEPSDEEARRKEVPPVRGNTRKGSVLIRDVRLWHRGVPNLSKRPRHMIAMIHQVRWLDKGKPLRFNKGCESAFNHPDLDANAIFIDEPMDYLLLKTRLGEA